MTGDLKKFEIKEINEWLAEARQFFINPRQIVKKITAKNQNKATRQLLFFFLVNCASYLFLSLGTSLNDWIRPATINILTIIPTFLLFYAGTLFFKGKRYWKDLLTFFLGVHLLVTPVAILLFAAFLNTENYTYRYVFEIIDGIALLYFVFVVGFAIEDERPKAFKLTLVCYFVLNLAFVVLQRVDIDPYASTGITATDPIYQEYVDLTKPLKFKEKLPTTRMIIVYKGKVQTNFSTQDIITEHQSLSEPEANKLYMTAIADNISHLDKQMDKLLFKRNRAIADTWLVYFKDIMFEAEYKIKDTTEIKKLGLAQYDSSIFRATGMEMYLMHTDIPKMVNNQILLKWYNNSIVTNHKNSERISEVPQIITFFVGHIVDYAMGEYIFKDGEPKPYKDIFLELE